MTATASPAAAVAPTAAASTPAPAAGVELLGQARGSGYRDAPGLVRRRDGQTLQLTPLLYAVLSAVDGMRDRREIAAVVSVQTGQHLEPEDIGYLLEEKLRPLGVLRDRGGAEPVTRTANPLLALRLRYVVSDPERTRRLTRPFAWLFQPWVVAAVVAAFAFSLGNVLFTHGLAAPIDQVFHDPRALLAVVALTILSTGFHEFGHAAACTYSGATPGAMGVGLYLVWPAFYTDVTDSYRLSRAGRLRVDLGGLYFNAVFAVGVYAAWMLSGWDALLLLIVTQVVQMVRHLIPLVRFDGYHILADLTGVPDLFQHIGPTLAGLRPSRWGQPSRLRPGARLTVTLWVAIVVPVLAALLIALVLLLPRLVATAWSGVGAQWAQSLSDLGDGRIAAGTVAALGAITLVSPVLGVAYLLARVVRRGARRAWLATAQDPRQRAVLLGAAIAAAVFALVAWWPQGQYRPVEPAQDRGTLTDLLRADPRSGRGTGGAPIDDRLSAAEVRRDPRHGGGGSEVRDAVLAAAPGGPAAAASADDGVDLVTGVRQDPRATPDRGDERGDVVEPGAGTADGDWPFETERPPPPVPGDNRAWAINTTDGATITDLEVDLAWVTDGRSAMQRNEAWALARCVDCRTVAAAYQVLLIVGESDVITPANTSVATNERCERCVTRAVAEQLVVTIERWPDRATRSRIDQALADVNALQGRLAGMRAEDIRAVMERASRDILVALNEAGVISRADDPAPAQGEPTPEPSSEPSPSEEPSPSAEPSPSEEPSSEPEPSTGEGPAEEPSPSEEPSHSEEPSPSEEPSSEPSQEPSPSPSPSEEPSSEPSSEPSGSEEPSSSGEVAAAA